MLAWLDKAGGEDRVMSDGHGNGIPDVVAPRGGVGRILVSWDVQHLVIQIVGVEVLEERVEEV